MNRTIIIGNCGSGKTVLANKISSSRNVEIIHLDELFWEPGGLNIKRSPDLAFADIETAKLKASWIVEGVFGELAELFTGKADELVWLDIPWSVCREGLLARGSQSSKQFDEAKADENFKKLLLWAADYWKRSDLRSHQGHKKIFEEFKGTKIRIEDRTQIERFLAQDA